MPFGEDALVERRAARVGPRGGGVPRGVCTAGSGRGGSRGGGPARGGGRGPAPPFLRSLICSQSRAGSASWSAASSVSISSRSSPMNAAGSRGLRRASEFSARLALRSFGRASSGLRHLTAPVIQLSLHPSLSPRVSYFPPSYHEP